MGKKKHAITGILLVTAITKTTLAEIQFCLTLPSSGEFSLWAYDTEVTQSAGLAGFSVELSGTITSFVFEDLSVFSFSTGYHGFDVIGSGQSGDVFNIFAAQTLRALNEPIYGVAQSEVTTEGDPSDLVMGLPLLIGSGQWSGTVEPAIVASTTRANGFQTSRDGSTFALQVGGDCESGDLDGDSKIDLSDFTIVVDCLTGVGLSIDPDCFGADFELDGDVDLRDLARFLNRLQP